MYTTQHVDTPGVHPVYTHTDVHLHNMLTHPVYTHPVYTHTDVHLHNMLTHPVYTHPVYTHTHTHIHTFIVLWQP